MALAVVNSLFSNAGQGTPATITYTNAAACVMVAAIETHGNSSGFVPVTSVTDSAGITWHRRKQTQYISVFSGISGGVNHINHEIWWANITGVHASAVTVTFNLTVTNQQTSTTINQFQVTGSLVPATPWDINAALPGLATYSNNSGVSTTESSGYTTTSAAALQLTFLGEMGVTGNTATSSVGTGYTLSSKGAIGNATTGILSTGVEFKLLSASGAGTAAWATPSNIVEWIQITDAMTSDSTGTGDPAGSANGTISQALTKISQSASGTVTSGGVTGTVATHLSKANLSASAKEIFTGTAATNLTKISQLGTNALEKFIGSIQSNLPKISQSASGTLSGGPHGTITTSLSKVSQTLRAPGDVTGVIATALRKAALSLSAQEIVKGVIVTNIDSTSHFSQGIVANEQFIGQIVTRLTRANFALAAEERFIGSVTMRLGSISGHLVSNVVQAEVIILGPIHTDLGKISSSILGAKLGAPGNGKWSSYRYLDS